MKSTCSWDFLEPLLLHRVCASQVQITRGGKLKARKGVNVPDIVARPKAGSFHGLQALGNCRSNSDKHQPVIVNP